MRTWWILFILAASGAAARAEVGGWVTVDRVVAVVNQDVVLESELERRLTYTEASLQPVPDAAARAKRRVALRQQLIQALIDERMFVQEATRIGATATDEEVNRAIEQVKSENHLDDAGLAAAVAKSGYALPQYREEIRRQILTAKVAGTVVRSRVQVRDADIRAAYEEARKRDPKGVAKYEDVRSTLYQQLAERGLLAEQQKWLTEQRALSFIDVRGLR